MLLLLRKLVIIHTIPIVWMMTSLRKVQVEQTTIAKRLLFRRIGKGIACAIRVLCVPW
jgi:hypothetical protein